MTAPNFPNRTLWIDDNLKVLRGINSECVDLVYLDPPFNTKRIYNAPLGSKAAGARFDDTWTMDSVKSEWAELQEAADPALHHTVVSAGLSADESMQAYLSFMALRLQECHRILQPAGCLYLHCDQTASHYLKQLLDCIFGCNRFLNEIIWSYRTGGVSKRYWPRKHDVILFYARSGEYRHNPLRERQYYDKPFFTTSVDEAGRHYSDVYVRDVWEENVKPLINMSKERTGWPTQKPLALLARIVEASTSPDDMVLDPFCGCATTMVAAERLGRRWAGIDIDEVAVGITQKRLQDETDAAVHNVDLTGLSGGLQTMHLPPRPPTRTDPDRPVRSPRIRQIRWHELGDGERRPCPGCDRRKYFDDFDLDHIVPKAKGGADVDDNLRLLCSSCNRIKGARLTMSELRELLRSKGTLT